MEKGGGSHLNKRGNGGGGGGEGKRGYSAQRGGGSGRGRGRNHSGGWGQFPDRRNVDNPNSAGRGSSSCDDHNSAGRRRGWKSDGIIRETYTHPGGRYDTGRKPSWQNLGDNYSQTANKDKTSHREDNLWESNNSSLMDGCSGSSGCISDDKAPLEYQVCRVSLVEKKSSPTYDLTSPESSSEKIYYSSTRTGLDKQAEVAVEKASVTGCSQRSPQDCSGDAGFDICRPKAATFALKPSLFEKNREKRRAAEAQKGSLLRDGMVLLRNYVSVPEQVKIVKECRRLGLGSGGFYQPGYRDGAKLQLRMMCLGKNWDPETSTYGELRPNDGARPPPVPSEFLQLVQRSIKDSHAIIAEECGMPKAEHRLPWMTPNICLVNFYTTSGRLGLHQDRDESKESLSRGVPVISISIGDSAEFLYGDSRDVDKAEKVMLASGDVLIFGGKSRHIYHGVSSIKANTAPKSLLEETNLLPGRLNLTFREY